MLYCVGMSCCLDPTPIPHQIKIDAPVQSIQQAVGRRAAHQIAFNAVALPGGNNLSQNRITEPHIKAIRLQVSNGRIINKKEAGPIQRFLYTAGSIVSNGDFSATCTPRRLLDDMRLYFNIHPGLIADPG